VDAPLVSEIGKRALSISEAGEPRFLEFAPRCFPNCEKHKVKFLDRRKRSSTH
jgi:hypothetical protein